MTCLKLKTGVKVIGPRPEMLLALVTAGDIRTALTADYDVVIEADHLHLEFQPRRQD